MYTTGTIIDTMVQYERGGGGGGGGGELLSRRGGGTLYERATL